MAHFAFLMLPEPGHIFPTLRVARTLENQGHIVSYISIRSFESFFRHHSFHFIPILDNVLPTSGNNGSSSGFIPGMKIFRGIAQYLIETGQTLSDLLLSELHSLEFDVLVCDTFFVRECGRELMCGFRKTIVSLSVTFPYDSLVLSLGVPELILCPLEFDIPAGQRHAEERSQQRVYAEPSCYQGQSRPDFPWSRISTKKDLIYCSFGTQSARYPQAASILATIVETLGDTDGFQLLVVADELTDHVCSHRLAKNVDFVSSAPQMDILPCAKLFITHGGLGSLKESIMNAVPMLVIPFDHDQPGNAARVEYHKLGRYCPPSECAPERLREVALELMRDDEIQVNLNRMGRLFWKIEAQSPAAQFLVQVSANRSRCTTHA